MDYEEFTNVTTRERELEMSAAFPVLMRKVYLWMTLALVITGFTAYYVASSEMLLMALFSNQILFWGLVIGELVLVFSLSAAINKLSLTTATLMFVLYSVINGATMSFIFLVYTTSSITNVFLITAATFAVMAFFGVGESMGPQLMAEIGDLRRFAHQKSLVGFAGTDPIKDDSGDKVSDSTHSSKRGSPYLRRTLYLIMSSLLQNQPQDDPVYQFLDKKRSEGKKYYVYMTAGMTKFLRIYYGKVRDCLKEKGLWEQPSMDEVNPG